jgi:hypothetical protein
MNSRRPSFAPARNPEPVFFMRSLLQIYPNLLAALKSCGVS